MKDDFIESLNLCAPCVLNPHLLLPGVCIRFCEKRI